MTCHLTCLTGHIILTPILPVFALTSKCRVFSGEAENTNFKIFRLTLLGVEPTSLHSRRTRYYASTEAMCSLILNIFSMHNKTTPFPDKRNQIYNQNKNHNLSKKQLKWIFGTINQTNET